MSLLGLYEKATPKSFTWYERLSFAKRLGFDFVEMSIDETDERLSRLDWTIDERKEISDAMFAAKMKILSICLSGHRRYPFGSKDSATREKAMEIMQKTIDLAFDLGVRSIQLAGYDVYYEDKSIYSRELFIKNLRQAVSMASEKGIILSIETMDDPFINSITKYLEIKKQIPSPFLQVYPDVGNLTAWPNNDVAVEFEKGIGDVTQIHLKDTLPVSSMSEGTFKGVKFGEGTVDFNGCLYLLKSLGYNGPFVIEMWSETSSDPEEEIIQALNFIMPKFREVGYFEKQSYSRYETASL